MVLVPAAWRQAPVSVWLLKSLLRAVAAASERRVHLSGGDVPGLCVCRAEAAEKFPGAQVVRGQSFVLPLFSLAMHRSP